MLLLWALARVGHNDPPVQLWVTQRAATQASLCVCEPAQQALCLLRWAWAELMHARHTLPGADLAGSLLS